MSLTFLTGFEAQQAASDNVTLSGTASIVTTEHRTGLASLRCNPASGASGYITVGSGSFNSVTHFGIKVASLPGVDRLLMGSVANQIGLVLKTTGFLELWSGGVLKGTSSTALSVDGLWHWIGVNGQPAGTAGLQIDGVVAIAATVAAGGASGLKLGFSGTEAGAADIYIDDVIIELTSFLSPSKVDTALPISDNTVTGVTNGAGTGTNLWDGVNNTPPAGVASASETATTNIKFPASTTESYIANLETYTTLGIASGDAILATQGVIRHGEDIATGTKNGTYVGTTNPTQTDNSAFVFGLDGGAHAAESGANFWASKFGTITNAPSPTLGTSPTLQVDRASESRVGCIDFMGMLVAWTPATVASLLIPKRHRGLIVR